jgi:hypothetical protein
LLHLLSLLLRSHPAAGIADDSDSEEDDNGLGPDPSAVAAARGRGRRGQAGEPKSKIQQMIEQQERELLGVQDGQQASPAEDKERGLFPIGLFILRFILLCLFSLWVFSFSWLFSLLSLCLCLHVRCALSAAADERRDEQLAQIREGLQAMAKAVVPLGRIDYLQTDLESLLWLVFLSPPSPRPVARAPGGFGWPVTCYDRLGEVMFFISAKMCCSFRETCACS